MRIVPTSALLAVFCSSAAAQLSGPYIGAQQTSLVPSDAVPGDALGLAIDCDGSTAVVGNSRGDLPGVDNAGAAYVFVRSGAAWTQQQKLIAADFDLSDQFGDAVSISGDTIAVGASVAGVGPVTGGGAAYVFVRSGGVWTQQQKLLGADTVQFDRFGSSVAVRGDTLAVSAIGADPNGLLQAGAVYVFVRSGTTWTQQQKLVASDPGVGDQFGDSLALDGDTIAIGVRLDTVPPFSFAGSTYVFQRNAGAWSQQQKLTAFDSAANAWFGASVDVFADTLIVGAPRADVASVADAGAAYVYTRSGSNWSLQQQLLSPAPGVNEQFGHSVGVGSSIAVCGEASTEFPDASDAGAAHAFTRSGALWSWETTLWPDSAALGDEFGAELALSGTQLVVAAPYSGVFGAVIPFELTASPASYCTAKTNSQGCVPAMSWSGIPSVSAPLPFVLGASGVLNQRNGLLFYGLAPSNAPHLGGWLCVEPPLRRTALQNSHGTVGPDDCSGQFALDFNARIQSGVDPSLTVGAEVFAQYWSRDPALATYPSNLTNAVHFALQP